MEPTTSGGGEGRSGVETMKLHESLKVCTCIYQFYSQQRSPTPCIHVHVCIHVHEIDIFHFQRRGSSPYSSGDLRSGLGIVEQAQSSDSMVTKIIIHVHVQLHVHVYTCIVFGPAS